jgi:glycosyltransferase involved in cell wall biosynthesis
MRVITRTRPLVVAPAKLAVGGLGRIRTVRWSDYSRFFAVGDRNTWSVEEDARHLRSAAHRLGFQVEASRWARFVARQSIFVTSHFEALSPSWLGSSHRLATAYLHGRPGTPGIPEFDDYYNALRLQSGRIARIQVTHAEMEDLVLAAGVDPARVFRIPIGIDIEHFPLGDRECREQSRRLLGLPATGFVVGSFQKDGVGWGQGLEPKLVKGPDIFVAVVEELRERIPELVVLLTGPARGYVRRALSQRRIPFSHIWARSRDELAHAYQALDVYLISSRQEGGPKAVLEAMATGVPLVTTRVGQAQELVEHRRNGLLCDVDDVEALAEALTQVAEDRTLRGEMRAAGRCTAEQHALERLDPAWDKLLDGFVRRSKDYGR